MDTVSLAVLVGFAIFGFSSWRFKISYRFSIATGLVTLVLAGIVVAVGQDGVGSFIAIFAYCFLAVGVGLVLVEYATVEEGPLSNEVELVLPCYTFEQGSAANRQVLTHAISWSCILGLRQASGVVVPSVFHRPKRPKAMTIL